MIAQWFTAAPSLMWSWVRFPFLVVLVFFVIVETTVALSLMGSRVRFPFLVVFVFVSTTPLEVGRGFSFRAGCP